jgi:hypothetical protein
MGALPWLPDKFSEREFRLRSIHVLVEAYRTGESAFYEFCQSAKGVALQCPYR